MGAEGSEFKSRCPDFFMNTVQSVLPSLTFLHEPGPEYTAQGDSVTRTFLSPQFNTPALFDTLVLSAGYTTLTNGWLLTEVQLLQNKVWSPWVKLAFYSKKLNHSFDAQETDALTLHTDELHAKVPAQAYRFRLTLHGEMEVRYVTVCVTPAHAPAAAEEIAALPRGEKIIKIHPLSQMTLPVPAGEQKRLCSPTSLCMGLQTLGVAADLVEVARGVYDNQAEIFGNWTLNTAYASRQEIFACVTRFHSLQEMADCMEKGCLIAATIAYQAGELTGAAVAQTPGHLVLIAGWKDGKICVADPAARTQQDVMRFYDGKEFARAWLVRKRGAAYIMRKK